MFDRNLMKLEGMPAVMGALAVLAGLQAACIIGQAYSLACALSLLWEGVTVEGCAAYLVAFAVCFCLLQVVRFAQDTLLDSFAQKRACALRDSLVGRMFDPNVLLTRTVGSARVVDTATTGIDDVETYLRIIPPKMVGLAVISLPILVAEYVNDWPSGIILTVMFPVIIFFMVLLGRQARERSERQYAAYTRLTNRFMDTLRGLKTILAFGAGEHEGRSVHRHSELLRHATVKTLRTATLSSAVLDLCATFGVAAVAIMLAFRLIDGSITLATGLMALMLAPEYFTPIRSFASDYHASLDGKNALAAVLAMTPSLPPREGTDWGQSPNRTPQRYGKGTVPKPYRIALELEDVSMSYDGETAALEGVSLSVSGAQRVAIVGESGAGKSTLANILAGFIEPTAGRILIDGEPASLANDAWRSLVRYIPQRPSVFRLSLADNIRFYRPEASDDEVSRAIEAVGLQGLVDELPDGMHTLVGEGHRGLSGGEAHRVALARILLDEDARVLVFDEPTAHLDIETELELKAPMLEVMRGRLVFFATHRLHWTRDMDCVLGLSRENGGGPHGPQGPHSSHGPHIPAQGEEVGA